MVVVLPTPFTPTTSITYGLPVSGSSQLSLSCVLFSESSAVISSFKMLLSSLVETYLSRATRVSILSMIFNVVSTPTSDVIRISSKSSRTSSSTFDFPAIARVNLLKTLCLVFSKPLSSVSFLLLLKNPNIPISFLFAAKILIFI